MSSPAVAEAIGGRDSAVVVTDQVDVEALAEVYHRVHAADLHLVDHTVPTVAERLRWTAEAPVSRRRSGTSTAGSWARSWVARCHRRPSGGVT